MATSLFLCGDVMTGRGIDQVLPHPSRPQLFEPYVRDARDYVAFAERANGRVGRSKAFDYVWGDALEELAARSVEAIAGEVAARRREGDLVVVSLHWGSNWGYEVPREQRLRAVD